MRDDLGRQLQRNIREAADLVVGLGVIAFQQSQVQRRQLAEEVRHRLEEPAARAERGLAGLPGELGRRATSAAHEVRHLLDGVLR
ncbi:MAG: hypothetical protein ACRDYD_11565 [Acidimicrobiales bacterium]